MEEEIEGFSEKTISGDELNFDQLEPEREWADEIIPDESVSQITCDTGSEIDASAITGSTVWLFFDKNPSYAVGYNVCKKCSKKFKVTTSVTTLRSHLKIHQLKAPTKKQTSTTKQKNPFNEEEQSRHDEHLIQWIICDLQPFTVVDNDHFREFLRFFCPRYTIPDRHKVKGKNHNTENIKYFKVIIIFDFLLNRYDS